VRGGLPKHDGASSAMNLTLCCIDLSYMQALVITRHDYSTYQSMDGRTKELGPASRPASFRGRDTALPARPDMAAPQHREAPSCSNVMMEASCR
jgi:hypothetical protein